MYLDYWKLKRKPFENTPDPAFFYFSASHRDAYFRFQYALSENKGAILLTGDYGCGKTTLIRLLIQEMSATEKFQFALLNIPRGDGRDLLTVILTEFGEEDIPESLSDIERMLGAYLVDSFMNKISTVVIVDEAQLIQDKDALEELRLLLNFQLNDRFLINLFLVGQPEFIKAIDDMPQLKQRFFTRYHLGPLEQKDIQPYITHRLKIAGREEPIFSEGALELIWEQTKGVPRLINNLCDLSLLFGLTMKQEVISRALLERTL
ncbi:MAG: AAA family ATPase [Candidatus Electryoneaceae bacterium]|nr:AAA family ATPase [Candidatus Electryoneaceae bacterium]